MIKFYSGNLINQAVITASSENALFPASNLKHPFRSKVFRSQTNSSNLVFDFQETSEVDSVIIVPDSQAGFGISTATLKLNATSNFTSPAFTQACTFNTTHGIGYAEFAQQDFRFARLDLASSLGYCELSKVFIGKKIDFDGEVSIDMGWGYKLDTLSSTRKNLYGQRFTDSRPRQKKMNFSLRSLNPDELDQLLALYDSCGEEKPFFIRLGTTEIINDPDRFGGMFYMTDVPQIVNKSFRLYDLTISVEEAM